MGKVTQDAFAPMIGSSVVSEGKPNMVAHLNIDADFPGGNIVLERIEGGDIYLHQDNRDSSNWFYWYYRVRGAASRTLSFHFTKEFPFMDKDGVEEGDQGKNRKPHDHNRDYLYQTGEKGIYPSVTALRELVSKWSQHRLKIGIDMHCPLLRGRGHEQIHFPRQSDVGRFARQQEFLNVEGEVWIDNVTLVAVSKPEKNIVANPGFEQTLWIGAKKWRFPANRTFSWTEFSPIKDFLQDSKGYKIRGSNDQKEN